MRGVPDEYVRTVADVAAVDAGCYWHEASAERVRTFFTDFLRHSQGEWAGQPFELLDWQWNEIIRPLFAWKRPNGTRRSRTAHIEVPKKNGKSTLCAGLSLYFLIDDDEPGAQVYSAASDRPQAGIIYREAAQMVQASPDLRRHVQVIDSRKRLVFPKTGSFYQALSADAHRQEGLNIHALLFDELHAQPTRDLWDALEHGGSSRRQPMAIAITTAGWDRNSICWEQHEIARQILDGTFDDWSYFAFIAAADPEDDWTDPAVWRKANPSFGITVKADQFAEKCKQAQASPAKVNTFKRYRLNIWTEQAQVWLDMEAWDRCGEPFEAATLAGRTCYGGLDLSSKLDTSSLALVFPPTEDDPLWRVLAWVWIPEDNSVQREKRDRVPFRMWADQGFIETTPGNVIDYGFIEARVLELRGQYDLREVAFDPWNATQTSLNLQAEGVEMIEFVQGLKSFNEPTKELERLILDGKFAHGGNPVLRWMARNTVVQPDRNENIMPLKNKSPERIDAIVSTIMGIGRAISEEQAGTSVYEKRGFDVIMAGDEIE